MLMDTKNRRLILVRIIVYGEKNDEFSFSIKLMSKLVCLVNAVILDSVFSFDSIVVVLDSDI